jgi:hypothetical protein
MEIEERSRRAESVLNVHAGSAGRACSGGGPDWTRLSWVRRRGLGRVALDWPGWIELGLDGWAESGLCGGVMEGLARSRPLVGCPWWWEVLVGSTKRVYSGLECRVFGVCGLERSL